MPNITDITTGLRVPAQIPLDPKTICLSEEILSNLGNNNNLAYTYYDGLVVYCQEEKSHWKWQIANEQLEGLLEENFQYPVNWIVNEIDYSEKEYNFYPEEINQNNKFRFIELGVLIGGRGVDTSDPLVFEQLIISNLNNQFAGFPLTVLEDELIIFKVQVTEYGTFYTHNRKYFFPNMLGKGVYAPLSSAVNANQLEIAYIEKTATISSPEIIEASPNNVVFDLGDITGEELLDYVNTISVPEHPNGYNLSDTNKIYYFRFIDNDVTYLYYFDAENSLNGYGEYGADGAYLFQVGELILMFDSTIAYPINGTSNFITKFVTPNTIGNSRIFDNGEKIGIDTLTPDKDITFGNQSDREIGIKKSDKNTKGKNLSIEAGSTDVDSETSLFVSTNQNIGYWVDIALAPDGSLYACYELNSQLNSPRGIFKKGPSDLNFSPYYTNGFNNCPGSVTIAPNGDIYYTLGLTGIFKQTGGVGPFVKLPEAFYNWTSISAAPNGDIYAVAYVIGVFKQTGGVGPFVSLGLTSRAYIGVKVFPNNDIYAIVYNGDIYKQTGGIGTFVALNETSRIWWDLTYSNNGDIYATVQNSGIYKQTGGVGPFVFFQAPTAQGTQLQNWAGITTDANGTVYVTAATIGQVYKLEDPGGTPNLDGGTFKIRAGKGKGTGKSRVEIYTSQKTVSGSELQIETLRTTIDEEGNLVHKGKAFFEENIKVPNATGPLHAVNLEQLETKSNNFVRTNENLNLANRKENTLYGILDQYTGEETTLTLTQETNDADGVIYFDLENEKFKRNYKGYADVRWFGAKGDGVDLGIGDYTGDHFAINLALKICKKVILKDGVFIVKKPIVVNDEQDLFIDVTATLKLGDASNCTLLKNSHVDIYKDSNGVPTYPIGFKRHKNIKIHGKGRIDFNGWLQNRSDTAGGGVHDNPLVVGTPRFADGTGIGNYYVGWGCKFVDIDNFYFGGGLTTINARTYTFSCSGLTNYIFEYIISERTYYVQNQDFLNIVGNMYDGKVRNIRGVSGDEFIVISNNQLGDLTLRQGDVKRLLIENIFNWGINPASTPEVQLPLSKFEDGFNSHRLARISYTKGFVVDDITIRNCYATNSKMHAQIVISKLPYSPGVFPAVYDGDGYIGKVTIDNVNSPNAEGLLDFGDYTIVKNLIINNIVDRRVGYGDPRGFIANYENFTGEVVDFTNSKIENLTLSNVKTILGGGTNPSQSWIKFAGEIKNLTIDNYNIVTEAGSESNVLWNFLESNVKNFWLSNSDFSQFNKIFNLSNTDCVFFENNCTYKAGKDLETQVVTRANTSTFVIDNANVSIAVNGDILRTATGLKLFNGTFWQNLNKPALTTNKIPIQGTDDLVDSNITKNGEYEYDFGSPTKTSGQNIHKSPGFFGDTTPFQKYWYDGFNLFRTFMDGSFNMVFEVLQRGTEQSGIIFKVNGSNILNLKKTGIAQFINRVKGLNASEPDDFVTLGQLTVENNTTSLLSVATLNATYPTAVPGFEVHCRLISSGPIIYKKDSVGWLEIRLNIVV